MFVPKKIWGDHTLFRYDTDKHQFREYFQTLYNQDQLNELHFSSEDFKIHKNDLSSGVLNDKDTDLHQRFYKDIKCRDEFKRLYCSLIRDIHLEMFPNERVLIYQSYPSIRIQFMDSITVPPHCDSDSIGNHPNGEKNFIIPITRMTNTNTLHIESKPGKEDYEAVEMDYGDILKFNGNKCVHFNKKNTEGRLRISLDFRIILIQDYKKYLKSQNVVQTQPRDLRKPTSMIIGGYYQVCFKDYTLEEMLKWYSPVKIIQSRPNFDYQEAQACAKYLESGGFITEYKETVKFERQLAEYIGVNHCIMTTSGTTALTLALLSLGICNKDEVIVPNYTMIATVNAVKSVGAKPVIVDVDQCTFTITSATVEKYITSRTKAVLHVSLNNRCKEITKLASLCHTRKLYLIEDSAQSLGCRFEGRHFGTFGDIGCFSLSSPKIISTGQGGFMITNDDTLAKKARLLKNFGRSKSGSDVYDCIGYNFKYTDLQAVIGQVQLTKLDLRIQRMREIYGLYYKSLNHLFEMKPPPFEGWFPWFIDILTPHREEIQYFLKQHNIQSRFTYPSIIDTPMYRSNNSLPNSQKICQDGLFLPSHTLLTDTDIEYICVILKVWDL